ncbi:MAG TPA: hypothetical protein V6C71_26245 [Coleofasciculaceae cyanobacterium]
MSTILTTVIALSLTAFAQDTQQLGSTRSGNLTVAQAQTSIQNNSNFAAAVGTGNLVIQNTDRLSVQDRLNLGTYDLPATPNAKTAVQVNANEAAAIGTGNVIGQDSTQTSVQGQVNVNQYLPPSYQH